MVASREMFEKVIGRLEGWQAILTDRQVDMVLMYVSGRSYEDIAKKHDLSIHWVKIILHGKNRFGKDGAYTKLKINYDKRRAN